MKKINDEIISSTEESNKTLFLPDGDAKSIEVANLKAKSKEFQSGQELEDWVRGLTGSLHADQGKIQ
jgi:hypothetical protein